MFKNNLKSHLDIPKSEQGGILFLVIVLIVLLIVFAFVDFSTEEMLDISSPEIVAKQQEIDSLRSIQMEASKPKLYPFNPNFITDYKAYTLGMSTDAYDKLKEFRNQGKWINSKTDFKKVTGVSDSWLDSIAPYFKFPEWVANPKPRKTATPYKISVELSYSEKIDLNKATPEQLQEISGIGEALGNRIANYREKIGGFSDLVQLYEVYGLSSEVINRATKRFAVKTPKPISKINVNTASASDLATLPGINFELAKRIWEFVHLREHITSLSELEKIDDITPQKLRLFQLYLSVE